LFDLDFIVLLEKRNVKKNDCARNFFKKSD